MNDATDARVSTHACAGVKCRPVVPMSVPTGEPAKLIGASARGREQLSPVDHDRGPGHLDALDALPLPNDPHDAPVERHPSADYRVSG